MRWAAHSSDFARLAFVSIAMAGLSPPCAFAEAPARAHGAGLPAMLGWLSTRLAVPATVLAVLLLGLLMLRALLARRRPALQEAPPARYAPYALPARVSVALAAAARARR
jgi:hypothetical protein